MEIAVVASLLAKRDMDVNARHKGGVADRIGFEELIGVLPSLQSRKSKVGRALLPTSEFRLPIPTFGTGLPAVAFAGQNPGLIFQT
jgi:hypothetical protein